MTKHYLIHGDSRKMSRLSDVSVHLIVTSPPYWQLKDYGVQNQIGFNDTYEEYINHLNLVWTECFRVLKPGCRLCINIGDQFARSAYYGRYKVVSIHSEIIRFCETIGFDYMGAIIWEKSTSMHTSGGEQIMGSYPYPRGGVVKINYEYILLFRKVGEKPIVPMDIKKASALSQEEWNQYFTSRWQFNGAKQNRHIAVFPEELPKRLIKMFSFLGDVVLDPFMGSGTTALAAAKLGRNSVGYELNADFRFFYKEKVIDALKGWPVNFHLLEDNFNVELDILENSLPYRFVDVHQFNKAKDINKETYGSKVELSEDIQKEISLKNKKI